MFITFYKSHNEFIKDVNNLCYCFAFSDDLACHCIHLVPLFKEVIENHVTLGILSSKTCQNQYIQWLMKILWRWGLQLAQKPIE